MTAPHAAHDRTKSSQRDTDQPDQATAAPDDIVFATALRGYDRGQVEARIGELVARCGAEASRAERAEAELRAALERVERLQDSGAEARQEPGNDGGGFGVRVERVLKLAEREAAELRGKAAAGATGLVEKARAEAEQHRHQAEQALIARAAQMDQKAAERTADLNTREREITENLESAHHEAESILTAAGSDAAAERSKAEQRAGNVLCQAEEAAHQQRDSAAREVERLAAVQDGIRAELARLHRVLDGEISRPDTETSSPG